MVGKLEWVSYKKGVYTQTHTSRNWMKTPVVEVKATSIRVFYCEELGMGLQYVGWNKVCMVQQHQSDLCYRGLQYIQISVQI